MKSTMKYDPEDIESLLKHKQYHELYPEEKEFVLRHVEGQDEYESLRSTLHMMQDLHNHDEWLEPDPIIKHNLMREFVTEEKKGFLIWLNSLFAMPQLPEIVWYRRPAVRYAFASVVLLFGIGTAVWMFNKKEIGTDIAANKNEQQNNTDTANANTLLDKPTYAENNQPDVFPPAPVPVGEEPPAVEMFKYTPITTTGASIDEVTDIDQSASPVYDMLAKAEEAEKPTANLNEANADDATIAPTEDIAMTEKSKVPQEEIQVIKSNSNLAEADMERKEVQNYIAEDKKATTKDWVGTKRLETDYETPSATLPQNTFNNTPIQTTDVTIASGSATQLNTVNTISAESYSWDADQITYVNTPAKSASAVAIKDVLDLLYTAR